MEAEWEVTGLNGICRLAVAKNLQNGFEMSFTGSDAEEYLNGIWTLGTVRMWIGSVGKWRRQIVWPEIDEQIMLDAQQDVDLLFPSQAFTGLDQVFNDKQSVVYDFDNNTVEWDWDCSKVVYPFEDSTLNTYVFKYPFKQTVTETADIACFMLNCEPADVGTVWNVSVVSTDQEWFDVTKLGTECWYVSLFTDIEKSDGTVVPRGQFRKMSSESVTLKKTVSHNRVLRLYKN